VIAGLVRVSVSQAYVLTVFPIGVCVSPAYFLASYPFSFPQTAALADKLGPLERESAIDRAVWTSPCVIRHVHFKLSFRKFLAPFSGRLIFSSFPHSAHCADRTPRVERPHLAVWYDGLVLPPIPPSCLGKVPMLPVAC